MTAWEEIHQLVREHRLGMKHNAGSLEFTHPLGGRLQVPGYDNGADLAALKGWLAGLAKGRGES